MVGEKKESKRQTRNFFIWFFDSGWDWLSDDACEEEKVESEETMEEEEDEDEGKEVEVRRGEEGGSIIGGSAISYEQQNQRN